MPYAQLPSSSSEEEEEEEEETEEEQEQPLPFTLTQVLSPSLSTEGDEVEVDEGGNEADAEAEEEEEEAAALAAAPHPPLFGELNLTNRAPPQWHFEVPFEADVSLHVFQMKVASIAEEFKTTAERELALGDALIDVLFTTDFRAIQHQQGELAVFIANAFRLWMRLLCSDSPHRRWKLYSLQGDFSVSPTYNQLLNSASHRLMFYQLVLSTAALVKYMDDFEAYGDHIAGHPAMEWTGNPSIFIGSASPTMVEIISHHLHPEQPLHNADAREHYLSLASFRAFADEHLPGVLLDSTGLPRFFDNVLHARVPRRSIFQLLTTL